jgi:uncharacterized OB-fold protein
MSLGPPVQRLKSRPVTFTFELPTEKLTEFWNGLAKGNVYASKCTKCGKITFPPATDCSRCLSSGVEWVDLQGEGEIETFTHIVVRPTSFANHGTYTVAVARMKEGARVLAWLEGTKLGSVKVGAKVRLKGKVTEEGPTYAFTLA